MPQPSPQQSGKNSGPQPSSSPFANAGKMSKQSFTTRMNQDIAWKKEIIAKSHGRYDQYKKLTDKVLNKDFKGLPSNATVEQRLNEVERRSRDPYGLKDFTPQEKRDLKTLRQIYRAK